MEGREGETREKSNIGWQCLSDSHRVLPSLVMKAGSHPTLLPGERVSF